MGKVCQHDFAIIMFVTLYCRILIENGCVSHDPKMRSFTVMESTNKPHVVTLHPKEYCSCPATSLCYHIIVVWLSVGIPYSTDIKKVNLTQLRKNTKAMLIESLVESDPGQVNSNQVP